MGLPQLRGVTVIGNYARQVSQDLGGRAVLASTGWIYADPSPDGTVTVRADDRQGNAMPFEVYGGNGWADFGIDVPQGYEIRTIAYNDRTGRMTVTMEGQETGSRIIRTRTSVSDKFGD